MAEIEIWVPLIGNDKDGWDADMPPEYETDDDVHYDVNDTTTQDMDTGEVLTSRYNLIVDEKLPQRAAELGAWFMEELRSIDSPHVEEVRGRGLMVGVVLKESSGTARPFAEELMERGILAKETHEQVIRFAPPLVVSRQELEEALVPIREVLQAPVAQTS